MEFRRVCVPLIGEHGSTEDSVVTNGSYVAHRHICGSHKAGAFLCIVYCRLLHSLYMVHRAQIKIFHTCYLSRGSILLWGQCNTLCTSGFVDDVMFSHSGTNTGRPTDHWQIIHRDSPIAAPAVKSAIVDCIVFNIWCGYIRRLES